MSLSSWLVAGIVPGVERQPLKKLDVDENALLKLLNRWQNLSLARPAPLRTTLAVMKRIAIVHPSGPTLEVSRRRGLEMLGSGVRRGRPVSMRQRTKMPCSAMVARHGAVLFLGRRRIKTATSNLGDFGDAAETGRICATGAPDYHPLATLIYMPSRGHEWGTAAARLASLKIWQASCIAGALTATSLAAIGQIAVPRSSIATPNARVADAFRVPLNVTTVLTNAGAAFPAPAIETRFDRGLSANAIVAAGFSAAAPDSVPPSDVTSSQGPMLQVASLETASPENSATLQQDRPPAASPNPGEGKPSYLKYYVYSEIPPPEKPARIALSALSEVPLGTPVQEIERAAEAFGVDVNFMKAVAKIESDFNPRQRTGSYVGLFQLSKFEFSKYGSGDILNPRDNAMGAAYKFLSEAALFEIMTQKNPTFSDLYLIHQQGWEGAAQHISHPQRIAWNSMCATQEGSAKGERWCKRAIWGNTLPAVKREWKSVDRLTSGAFVAMWRDRVDTLYARYPVLTAAAERSR